MQSYKNMVADFNLRKMWKSIRSRTINRNKQKKIDSDSIISSMRRNTEMTAPVQQTAVRTSLDYYRNHLNQYQVQYTPLTTTRIMQYNMGMCTHLQPSFTALSVNARSTDCAVENYEFVASSRPREKKVSL